MPFSKSLVQSFRKNELFVGAGWRSYFAPYNPALGSGVASTVLGPTILDLQAILPWNTNAIPTGWFDLGWIKDFKITPQTKIGQVRSGYKGAVRAQYRGEVGEQFEFKFREFGRMQYKIATGNVPFNLLKGVVAQTAGPLSASGATTVPFGVSGYQATGAGSGGTAGVPTVFVPSGSGSLFAVGDFIVTDVDYNTTTSGFVGEAGVSIIPGQVTDVDFIRKTSDFVARITAIVPNAPGVSGPQDGLVLDQVMVGGGSGVPTAISSPPTNSKVQKISGWASREGATFITEWSATFVMDTVDGAQLLFYYPHVSISQFRDIPSWAIQNVGTTDLSGFEIDCMMEALAFDDPIDGETVVGYHAFIPRSGQSPAI